MILRYTLVCFTVCLTALLVFPLLHAHRKLLGLDSLQIDFLKSDTINLQPFDLTRFFSHMPFFNY